MIDPLAEIKAWLAELRPEGSATDPIAGRLTREHLNWLVGEVERLRKALNEVDNLASGAVRFGRQIRREAQAALGWDRDPNENDPPPPK